MEKIIIGFILALFPILNFIFAYYYSKKDGKLHLFRNHTNFYYSDRLFIIFNFLLVFTITFNYYWALVMGLFSIICSFVVNILWFAHHRKTNNEGHMYNFKTRRLTKAGLVHAVFLPIQLFLILYFVIFSLPNIFSVVNLIILLAYFFTFPMTSKNIHGRFILSDLLVFLLGLIVIIIKFLQFYF